MSSVVYLGGAWPLLFMVTVDDVKEVADDEDELEEDGAAKFGKEMIGKAQKASDALLLWLLSGWKVRTERQLRRVIRNVNTH